MLFSCQPLAGKIVLPLLGGSAAVWTTAVLFFQCLLLAGYLYAHGLSRLKSFQLQAVIHLGLMTVALFLPIDTAVTAPAGSAASPVLWELLTLSRSVGIPYFALSAAAPLLQSWVSRTPAGSGNPYALYAASNAGSLLGLLAYPFLIENRWGLVEQGERWTSLYVVLFLLVGAVAAMVWRSARLAIEAGDRVAPVETRTRLYWLAAAFTPSALMLAVTAHISSNLASMPLVWIAPLAVYLITFILAFGRRLRISWALISRLAPPVLALLCPVVGIRVPLVLSVDVFLIGIHLIVLFVGAMLAHSALAESRPDPAQLTEYYFWIALGGAIGGLFATLLAPRAFPGVFEYPLFLAASVFFLRPGKKKTVFQTAGLAALILGYGLFLPGYLAEPGAMIHRSRNFFGVKRVLEIPGDVRKLLHGDTLHGVEGLDPASMGRPVAYYDPAGPLGDVLTRIASRPSASIGVVGLGAGGIAGYGRPGIRITFFEIDAQVETIARQYFTYLERCGSQCDVRIGDGRLLLQNEPPASFDVIVLDAFSSDSIPSHLLSREAFAIYRGKLKPGGLLLVHVSNRYLRVRDLVLVLARDAAMPALVRADDGGGRPHKARSVWATVAVTDDALAFLPRESGWVQLPAPEDVKVWTDDFSNAAGLLHWSEP